MREIRVRIDALDARRVGEPIGTGMTFIFLSVVDAREHIALSEEYRQLLYQLNRQGAKPVEQKE